MGGNLEVDLHDLLPPVIIFEVLGRYGALRMRRSESKFPSIYFVDSQTLVRLSMVRNEIANRQEAAWGNADIRLRPNDFYKLGLYLKIEIIDFGDEAFNDFMEYLQHVYELRNDEGMVTNISDLQSLMRNRSIDRNSGTLTDRIVRTLMYGAKVFLAVSQSAFKRREGV